MKNRSILAAAIAVMLGHLSIPATAQSFDRLYFFGDSLTDSGAFAGNPDAGAGARFTNDPGPVWAEILSARFGSTALANNPDNPDDTDAEGTDFAQGGARVSRLPGVGSTPSPLGAMPVSAQVDYALSLDEGSADSRALYSVWAGGNDVFFQLYRLAGGASQDDVVTALIAAAGDLATQVGRLHAAGARYILVPNLPDFSALPALIYQGITGVGAGSPNLEAAYVAAGRELARPASDPRDQAAVRQAAISAAAAELGVPAAVLSGVVEQLSTAAGGLSGVYNQALYTYLGGSDANVIPLDIFGLYGEMLADPARYGLLNVTGTACSNPFYSLGCTSDDLVSPTAGEDYLFADYVHPTSSGHRIVADYAQSVIEAPALVAGLGEVPLAMGRMHQRSLEGQMPVARDGTGIGRWTLFAAGGGASREADARRSTIAFEQEDDGLLTGIGYRSDANWYAGFALGGVNSDGDFAGDRGEFEVSGYYLSAFADYRSEHLFGHLIGSLAPDLDFDRVERRVRLGPTLRTESGATDGDAVALGLLLGGDLSRIPDLHMGPLVGFDYQSVQVSAYRERGDTTTTMGFGGQKRDSLMARFGLYADYVTGTGTGAPRFRVELMREEELKDESRSLNAYLASTPDNDFTLYDIEPERGAWHLGLGLSMAVVPDVRLNAGANLRQGDDSGNDWMLSLGIGVDL